MNRKIIKQDMQRTANDYSRLENIKTNSAKSYCNNIKELLKLRKYLAKEGLSIQAIDSIIYKTLDLKLK